MTYAMTKTVAKLHPMLKEGHPYTRRQQIGFRVCAVTKRLLNAVAASRGMSISEYLARLVSDHLTELTRRSA